MYMEKYVVCGKLTVTGDLTVNGTISDVRNISSLIKILNEGNYKDIMELTDDKRTVENLIVDDIVLINFDCEGKSELIICGSSICLNSQVLE
ncbi:MAG: hypothetical protein CBB97_15470 [Candidatus Endolissoclinum sp. TMED37]|nr:MAG: hypothetical protein CBB97_15470 [Candidatus Endolissoclinum sp. TMED37]